MLTLNIVTGLVMMVLTIIIHSVFMVVGTKYARWHRSHYGNIRKERAKAILHLPPVGIGIIGRAGWAPKDRNVIDQFYSFGIGGFGMLIPGRENDGWGVGWSGTHISSDR